jgi:hypothetical protein
MEARSEKRREQFKASAASLLHQERYSLEHCFFDMIDEMSDKSNA